MGYVHGLAERMSEVDTSKIVSLQYLTRTYFRMQNFVKKILR